MDWKNYECDNPDFVCNDCLAKGFKWRNYWCGVMISSTTPSVKDAKKALRVRDKKTIKTIERLLVFIECIPFAIRGAMSVALSPVFDMAYDGLLDGSKCCYDVARDKNGVLWKIWRWGDFPSTIDIEVGDTHCLGRC